jgi:hypothetical protein
MCVMCRKDAESVTHSFHSCDFTRMNAAKHYFGDFTLPTPQNFIQISTFTDKKVEKKIREIVLVHD